MSEPLPEFLTPKEIQKALKISSNTFYRLCKDGEFGHVLSATGRGTGFRVRREDFDEYLRRNSTER